jgi:subtilase family serine protease
MDIIMNINKSNINRDIVMKKILSTLIIILVVSFVSMSQNTTVRLDTTVATPGDSITVPVYVSNFNDIGSFTLYIQYNYWVLGWGRALNWNSQLQCNYNANAIGGTVIFTWSCTVNASIENGKLVDLKFKYNGGLSDLIFNQAACEITDEYADPVTPAPTYINGKVVQLLSVNPTAGQTVLCTGGITQLHANATGGFGNYSFLWVSNPAGFSSFTSDPYINPTQSTVYYVSVTDGVFSASGSIAVTMFSDPVPGVVSNMLPADGTIDLNIPVSFSWSPGTNATSYDLYIWVQNSSPPVNPTVTGISVINYTFYGLLAYGTTYDWKIISKNQCYQTTGPTQAFSVRHLPDLRVDTVINPSNAYSGQSISVSWKVKNYGLGNTLTQQWQDKVYLSADNILQTNIDYYLGSIQNLSYLNPDQSYLQTATFGIPQELVGNYYVIVYTDYYNSCTETNNDNNTGSSVNATNILLTPPPDLQVTSIIVSPMTVFSGQAATISWQVSNLGTGPTLVGTWYDKIYFTTNSSYNLTGATDLGTFAHSGTLNVNSNYTSVMSVTIPSYITGTYYIYIKTDFYNNVYEHANENNNVLKSDSITVILTPPPNLVVTDISCPLSADNNQNVIVNWTVENQGANQPPNSNWYDRIYLSPDATFNPGNSIILGNYLHWGTLYPGDNYSNQAGVVIPSYISGPYYFYIFTDCYNYVFENVQENDNILRSDTSIIIHTPDLTVSGVVIPVTGNSGQTLTVHWSTKNSGQGKIIGRSWNDKIFLSTIPAYSPPTVTLLGAKSFVNQSINAGDSVNNQITVTIPNGTTGLYYIIVKTDYDNNIYESNENNNEGTGSSGIQIELSPWPDLIVTEVNLSEDTLTAGQSMEVSFTVRNNGTGNTPGTTWTDKIYISDESQWNAAVILLKQVQRSGVLNADSTYDVTTNIQIPYNLANADYWIFVYTDANDAVYEYTGNNNNYLGSNPLHVLSYPPVDLTMLSFTGPESANSGQDISIQWTVKNLSSIPSLTSMWYDALYLSADTTWNNSDTYLGRWQHTGTLNAGNSYSLSKNFTIPNGLSGTYYLIMVADYTNYNNDYDFSNNYRTLLDVSNNAVITTITLTPPPDLQVTSFICPNQGTAGQPIMIHWTVTNSGTGPTTTGTWTEKAYLSIDFTIGWGDIQLGAYTRNGNLLALQSYTDSMEVFLPVYVEGNYFIIFRTDDNNSVYEHLNEGNNIITSPISVIQPPPCDLIVTTITAPDTALAGSSLTINWNVMNIGQHPANGTMKDNIYLSADNTWDVNDVLFGTCSGYVNLSPNAEVTRSITKDVESVQVGYYYVIVRTDILNNIFESNDNNNENYSQNPVYITVEELQLNTLKYDTLVNNKIRYYRIVIPSELSGESMLATLEGDTINGFDQFYIRYDQSPTMVEYDFAGNEPFSARQQIIVPDLLADIYYLLVKGSTSAGNFQIITLFAKILDFEILSVQKNKGGNTGKMTALITGSKFQSTMQVMLRNANDSILAENIYFTNQTKVFATFDLTGMPLGYYDVVAFKQNGDTTILNNGFEIIAGVASDLSVYILSPPNSRPNVITSFTIEYTNLGNIDIENPEVNIQSGGGAPIALTVAELDNFMTDLLIPVSEANGPPNILRPGVTGVLTIYAKATSGLGFIINF